MLLKIATVLSSQQPVVNTLPISAVVVCYNEAGLLATCLASLQFCQEIIVIDLGSTDASRSVASEYAHRILTHQRLPDVGVVRNWATDKTRFDWILFIDPDERIDDQLAEAMAHAFQHKTPHAAAFSVPWQFYFKKHRLRGTFWGMPDTRKTILINRRQVHVPEEVHKGYEVTSLDGQIVPIKREERNVLHHYWMNGWGQLLEKHRRYLLLEGEAKFKAGWRYNRKKQVKQFLTTFNDSFVIYRGWQDGVTGFSLSLFYAWYNFNVWHSLKKYQQTQR